MTKNEAIEYMKGSISVPDWNSRRYRLKLKGTSDETINHIDASGLIVKVLGADPIPSYQKVN